MPVIDAASAGVNIVSAKTGSIRDASHDLITVSRLTLKRRFGLSPARGGRATGQRFFPYAIQ